MITHAYVIVSGGAVVEQHETSDPDIIAQLVADGAVCIDGMSPLPDWGWTYAGAIFTPPPQ